MLIRLDRDALARDDGVRVVIQGVRQQVPVMQGAAASARQSECVTASARHPEERSDVRIHSNGKE